MDERVSELERRVEELSAEVLVLREEFARVLELAGRAAGSGTGPSSPAVLAGQPSEVGAASSVGSYAFVDSASVLGGGSGPYPSLAPTIEEVGGCNLTPAEREVVCQQIGRFVRQSLRGEWHGSSGRDRINLPSKIWIVFKDFYGQEHNPVLVFRNWGSCRAIVKRGGDRLGQSVFVGLPTEQEAKLVTSLAGISWPAPSTQ